MCIGHIMRGGWTGFVSIILVDARSTADREFAEEASNPSTSAAAATSVSEVMRVSCSVSGKGRFVDVGVVAGDWGG